MKGLIVLARTGALLAILAPAPCQAQTAAPPTDATPPADASPPDRDVTSAAELFQQGRAAFDAGDFPVARARLLESARLNPRVGTFISLAECDEALGLLAGARAHWQQAADLAHAQGDPRAGFAQEHLGAVDPRVPRLTLVLPEGAPGETMVRIDDVVLGAASLGLAMPAEVGKHAMLVTAPGRETARDEIDLVEGEQRTVTVAIGPALPAPPPAPASAPASAEHPRPRTAGAGPLRVTSYVAMALGLAGVGTGAYFGVKAIDGREPAGCTGNVCTTTDSAAARDGAIRDGNLSTGLFIAGGTVLAGGAALWFVTRPAPAGTAIEWSPSIGAEGVGVRAQGRW